MSTPHSKEKEKKKRRTLPETNINEDEFIILENIVEEITPPLNQRRSRRSVEDTTKIYEGIEIILFLYPYQFQRPKLNLLIMYRTTCYFEYYFKDELNDNKRQLYRKNRNRWKENQIRTKRRTYKY